MWQEVWQRRSPIASSECFRPSNTKTKLLTLVTVVSISVWSVSNEAHLLLWRSIHVCLFQHLSFLFQSTMSELAGNQIIKMPLYNPPMPYLVEPLPITILNFARLQVHDHPVGVYCFFCACTDCRLFFGRAPIRCVNPHPVVPPPPPRYSYMGLVNNLRAAAERREEERQERLRAQREAVVAALTPKKERAPRDPIKRKGLRHAMKRRRQ